MELHGAMMTGLKIGVADVTAKIISKLITETFVNILSRKKIFVTKIYSNRVL